MKRAIVAFVILTYSPCELRSEPFDDPQARIAAALSKPFTNDKAIDGAPIGSVVEFLSTRTEVQLLVDRQATDLLSAETLASLPALNDVRFDAVLRMVLEPHGATFLIRRDYILITTRSQAAEHIGLDANLPPAESKAALVNLYRKNEPLEKLLDELADATDTSIVLAAQAKDHANDEMTVRLKNVPLGVALRVVAEQAGLVVVEDANLFLITTAERAAEYRKRIPNHIPSIPESDR